MSNAVLTITIIGEKCSGNGLARNAMLLYNTTHIVSGYKVLLLFVCIKRETRHATEEIVFVQGNFYSIETETDF